MFSDNYQTTISTHREFEGVDCMILQPGVKLTEARNYFNTSTNSILIYFILWGKLSITLVASTAAVAR